MRQGWCIGLRLPVQLRANNQFDVTGWHSKLGGGALADAIMDRIISKSQTIKIFGDKSMRSR